MGRTSYDTRAAQNAWRRSSRKRDAGDDTSNYGDARRPCHDADTSTARKRTKPRDTTKDPAADSDVSTSHAPLSPPSTSALSTNIPFSPEASRTASREASPGKGHPSSRRNTVNADNFIYKKHYTVARGRHPDDAHPARPLQGSMSDPGPSVGLDDSGSRRGSGHASDTTSTAAAPVKQHAQADTADPGPAAAEIVHGDGGGAAGPAQQLQQSSIGDGTPARTAAAALSSAEPTWSVAASPSQPPTPTARGVTPPASMEIEDEKPSLTKQLQQQEQQQRLTLEQQDRQPQRLPLHLLQQQQHQAQQQQPQPQQAQYQLHPQQPSQQILSPPPQQPSQPLQPLPPQQPSQQQQPQPSLSQKLTPAQQQASLRPPVAGSPRPQAAYTAQQPLPATTVYKSHNPQYPKILLQLQTQTITSSQLVAEVKSIYIGLSLVEAKAIEVIATQNQADPPPLANEQWQALVSLHRTLLQEHHDFLQASQHSSAAPPLRRVAQKYAMSARLWRHGIHGFLELLRRHLPDSREHMESFLYMAYSMLALLYETVPGFEDTWVECLGDISRYRMAIEEESQHTRDVWTAVSRRWYTLASDHAPATGRLYHHMGILARPRVVTQLYFYVKALCVPIPFTATRESILTLLEPALQGPGTGLAPVDLAFIRSHGLLFLRANKTSSTCFTDATAPETTTARLVFFDTLITKLDASISRAARDWISMGAQMAVVNCCAFLQYGADSNPLMQMLRDVAADMDGVDGVARRQKRERLKRARYEKQSTATDVPMADKAEKGKAVEGNEGEDEKNAAAAADDVLDNAEEDSDDDGANNAGDDDDVRPTTDCSVVAALAPVYDLVLAIDRVVLARLGDPNCFGYLHVRLVFLAFAARLPGMMVYLENTVPWDDLALALNHMLLMYGATVPMATATGAAEDAADKPKDENKIVYATVDTTAATSDTAIDPTAVPPTTTNIYARIEADVLMEAPEAPLSSSSSLAAAAAAAAAAASSSSSPLSSLTPAPLSTRPDPPPLRTTKPLPEDWALRCLLFADRLYPPRWFAVNDGIDDGERLMEAASMVVPRMERILWLGCQLARSGQWLRYDKAAHKFSVAPAFRKTASSAAADDSADDSDLDRMAGEAGMAGMWDDKADDDANNMQTEDLALSTEMAVDEGEMPQAGSLPTTEETTAAGTVVGKSAAVSTTEKEIARSATATAMVTDDDYMHDDEIAGHAGRGVD